MPEGLQRLLKSLVVGGWWWWAEIKYEKFMRPREARLIRDG